MPLMLDLKAGDKVIINGAVIESTTSHTKLLVHNEAVILRQSEVLKAEQAATPATRLFFALQCAYIFPEKRDEHLQRARTFLKDYVEACPSVTEIGDEIARRLDNGEYYKALKTAKKLIKHEMTVFKALEKELAAELENLDDDD